MRSVANLRIPPGLRRAALIVVAFAIVAVWSREDIQKAGLGGLTVGLLAAIIGIAVAIRWSSFAPAIVLLLCAIVPYPVSFVGKTPFGVVTAAGAIAVLLAVTALILREAGLMAKGPPLETGVKILFVWSVWLGVSAASSFDPKLSLNDARQILFALPVAYVVGRIFGWNRPLALRFCYAAVILISILGIVQAATGFDPIKLLPASLASHFPLVDPGEAYRNGLVRVRVGFYHASDLGRVLAVSLPLLVVAAVQRGARPWLRIGTGLVVVAVVLTFTFSVWFAAAVGLLVFAAASQTRGRGAAIGLTVLGLVVVVGAIGPASQLIEARLHPTGSSLAEQELRLALIPASVDYANAHKPLGSGPGTFVVSTINYPINGTETPLIDDDTFTTELIEVGYPGAILFVVGMIVLGLGWWRKRSAPLYAASIGGLAAFIVCSATVDSLARDAPLLFVFLILGVATGVGEAGLKLENLRALKNVERPVPEFA